DATTASGPQAASEAPVSWSVRDRENVALRSTHAGLSSARFVPSIASLSRLARLPYSEHLARPAPPGDATRACARTTLLPRCGLAPTGRTPELGRCAAIPVSVLVVDRAHHVDGRVTTLPVVDGFDPVNRLGSCASPRRP